MLAGGDSLPPVEATAHGPDEDKRLGPRRIRTGRRHEDQRRGVGREVLGGLIDADLIRQLARHEAKLEALRETIDHERQLARQDVENLRTQLRSVEEALARADTVLRGHKGDNGLSGRVSALEGRWKREDEKQSKWDARTWAIAFALFTALLALVRDLIP